MGCRKQVGIVLGYKKNKFILGNFEHLNRDYDVTIYAFRSDFFSDRELSRFQFKLFEEIEDMPGYMRGIEEDLKNKDLIIAVESTSLSSFQGSRVAEKFKKPFAVYSTEWQKGVYDGYQNIKAIQYHIINQANIFFAPNVSVEYQLLMDGVDGKKIKLAPFVVDESMFSENKSRREKFRQFLNFPKDSRVILIQGSLTKEQEIEEILYAVKLLANESGDFKSYRFIFACPEENTTDLKYFAYELGIGNSVFFLHQNIDHFIQDLYCSSDISLHPFLLSSHQVESLPIKGFDQLKCGVVQIGVNGDVVSELMGKACLSLKSWNRISIFKELLNLEKQEYFEEVLNFQKEHLLEINLGSENVIHKQVVSLIGVRVQAESANNLITKADLELEKGNLSNVEELIVKISSLVGSDVFELSEVERLKGDLQYSQGEYENALSFFQKSLAFSSRNYKSYKGLGFIAWQGHSHDEALSFFKKALAIEQNDYQSMMGVGLIHKRVGLIKTAMFWFEKSLMIDVKKCSALAPLIQLCLDSDLTDLSILTIERVIDIIGEKKSLMMCLGNLYLKSGRVAEGKMILNQAFLKTA